MRCRGTVRGAFLHEIKHPRAKFHWMGSAHAFLPVMLAERQSHISPVGNPEADQREHDLNLLGLQKINLNRLQLDHYV